MKTFFSKLSLICLSAFIPLTVFASHCPSLSFLNDNMKNAPCEIDKNSGMCFKDELGIWHNTIGLNKDSNVYAFQGVYFVPTNQNNAISVQCKYKAASFKEISYPKEEGLLAQDVILTLSEPGNYKAQSSNWSYNDQVCTSSIEKCVFAKEIK